MDKDYRAFLDSKAVTAKLRGLENPPKLAKHLFPFQRHCVDFALRAGSSGLFLDTGLGKALPITEVVLTPSGPQPIGTLVVGDYVIGRDGLPTRVIGVFPQGVRPCYKITFTDGATVNCDNEHLWAVRSKVQKYREEPYRVVTLNQIVSEGLKSQSGWRHFIPMTEPVAFDGDPLPIDPYVMGALLGDGYLNKHSPKFTTADAEMVETIDAALPAGIRLISYGGYDYGVTTGKNNGRKPNPNPVHSALRELGLVGSRSETKFIPHVYKYASIQDRIRILQGLLDTDGHVRPIDNNVEYTSTSQRLASDVAFIVRSLGGRARIRKKPTTHQMAYRMSICLPDQITPFSLTRKASVYRPRPKYKPTRAICGVEKIADAEMVCIKVAATDGLFLTADCVVTHNTECQLEFCQKALEATNGKALILTPLAVAGQTKRRADRWGYEARVIREQSEAGPGINILNYDRSDKVEPAAYGVVSLDEASILKSFTGKTRRVLTDMFRGMRFKMVATATPAPNDHMEFGSYADFLDVMAANEMLSRFFINDTSTASQQWRLKNHAVQPFWNWMSSWARMAEKPSDLTGNVSHDDGFNLPPFNLVRHRARDSKIDRELEGLFGGPIMSATGLHEVKRQTSKARAETAAAALETKPKESWIIWCDTDYEADALKAEIPSAIEIRGSQTTEAKEERLEAFSIGKAKHLIAKPSQCGFGLDWSHCHNMAFVGRSYSYETWYQAVRRCWRFGQKKTVNVHLIVAEGEDEISRVIDRKATDHTTTKAAMREAMLRAAGKESVTKVAYSPNHKARLASWISAA